MRLYNKPQDRDPHKLQILNQLASASFPWHDLEHALEGVDITPLHPNSDFPGYDCITWAFEKVDFVPSLDFTHRNMMAGKVSGLIKRAKPKTGYLAAYYNKDQTNSSGVFAFDHMGVVFEEFGETYVDSKWGRGHIYRHPFKLLPEDYGTHVEFFEVINR